MPRLAPFIVFLLTALASTPVWASLDQKQVRKLISRIAGAQLPLDSVRVKRINETSTGAETTVEIQTAFRLVQDHQYHWHVAEVRIGQDQWEAVRMMGDALQMNVPKADCSLPDLSAKRDPGDLSAKRARCLIAGVLRIDLPSDAVRIKSVSDLDLPFGTNPSAIVEAQVIVDVRFKKEKGNWRASELRTGSGPWIAVDALAAGLNEQKRRRAQAELSVLARALEDYRKDIGFYVASDKQPVLIDHLSPRYLALVIRLDPWHKPYHYQGEPDRFVLRSDGPDGKENTADDIIVTSPSRGPS